MCPTGALSNNSISISTLTGAETVKRGEVHIIITITAVRRCGMIIGGNVGVDIAVGVVSVVSEVSVWGTILRTVGSR